MLDAWLAAGVLSAIVIVQLLGRNDRPPIILYCLGYQWLFCFSGVLYRGLFGEYPSDHSSNKLNYAILVMLVAVSALAMGVAFGMRYVQSSSAWRRKWEGSRPRVYSLNRLIILALISSLPFWIPGFNPRNVSYAFSQIILRIIEFRTVFIFILFLMAIRYGKGYGKTFALAAVVTIPLIATGGSGFAIIIILFLVAFIEERKVFVSPNLLRENPYGVIGFVGISASLVILAMIWNGALKPVWRAKISAGQVAVGKVERLEQFLNVAREEVPKMNWRDGARATASRTSDVPMMLGHVLERNLPQEKGERTLTALRHVTMPRFLFPNKKNLGSDSSLVRKYTGLVVAGIESNTSIGLGYLIELYIDFGSWGMIIAAAVLGAIIGMMYRAIYLVCPSRELYFGLLSAIMLQHFTSLDGSLAKILGGLIMAFVVMGVFMYFFGNAIDRFLTDPNHLENEPATEPRRGEGRLGSE